VEREKAREGKGRRGEGDRRKKGGKGWEEVKDSQAAAHIL